MHLKVRYYKDGAAAEETWDRPLDEAREIARTWMRDGAADLVELRNEHNELIFHHHAGKHDAKR